MIRAVFCGEQASVDIVWGQRISLKMAVARELGLDDTAMIEVKCELIGPKHDLNGHRWTLRVEAPDQEGRSANRISDALTHDVLDLVGRDVFGEVCVSLTNMGCSPSHRREPVAAVMGSL